MRNTIVTVVCAAAICFSAAAQKEQAAVDPAGVAFGYTDSTGSKLLMLAEDNRPMGLARAKTMVSAVCSEGREFPIRYVEFQKRTEAGNGRQDERNFANNEGHLFEIVRGKV